MSSNKTQLQEALKEKQDLSRVIRYINDLDDQLSKAQTTLGRLTIEQAKEFEELQALEQTSLKSMFYKVLGSKEQQIEKERQEYLQVALEYDEAKKTVELLEYERSVLEKKMVDSEKIDKRILNLKTKREKELMKSNSLTGQRLIQIVKGEDQFRSIGREIEEALEIGERAGQMLNQIVSLLKQSAGWGQWGRPGRNFNPSRYSRQSSIDRAKNLAYQTQQVLRKFEIELADVYKQQNYNLNFKVDSFNDFIHVLFNNLISDWIIQQKVKNAVSNVSAVRDRVFLITGSLEADRRNALAGIERLSKEREELVMKS